MIVLDSSAAIDLLVRLGDADWVERQVLADQHVHAPQLLDLEVANALRRFVSRGSLDRRRAELGLYDLSEMNVHRHGHVPLLERIWELRDRVTAYDAVYVALAEELGAPLVATDRRLACVHGIRTSVVAP